MRPDAAWADRFAIWRMRWLPYRTCEFLGPRERGPWKWQWPDVLRRSHRV